MTEQRVKVHDDPENGGRRQGKVPPYVHWRWVILVLALVLVALTVLFGLVLVWGISREPEQPVTCEINTKMDDLVWAQFSDSNAFYERQVIITGPRDQVHSVANDLGLELIEACRLNYLAESSPGDADRQFYTFSDKERRTLTTNLYLVPEQNPVDAVVAAINGRDLKPRVFADHNFVTRSPNNVCGSPSHIPVGSPYDSPVLLQVGEQEAAKLFWEQWAFQQIGAGPAFKAAVGGAAALHQGEGTVVGVFDTSPFLDPWSDPANAGERSPIQKSELVKWQYPTMDIEPLVLDVTYPRWSAGPPEPPQQGADIRDHGLYVAGLVHAVAPESELRLIRVLDEYGCGDLYTLGIALARFIGELQASQKVQAGGGKLLDGVVINLSLGVANPDDEVSAAMSSCNQGDPSGEIALLCHVLWDAQRKGAVIVAAAGNGAGLAQIPAAYDFVIGVQASSRDGNKAGFSSQGDLFAPGGTDKRGCSCTHGARGSSAVGIQAQEGSCEAGMVECTCDCAEYIIGPILFPPERKAYWPIHYAYWNGTSFSAPLVSGQAALLLQAGVSPQDVGYRIGAAAMSSAGGSGVRIINLPESLP